jgi:hypothetical protein
MYPYEELERDTFWVLVSDDAWYEICRHVIVRGTLANVSSKSWCSCGEYRNRTKRSRWDQLLEDGGFGRPPDDIPIRPPDATLVYEPGSEPQ